MKKRLVKFFDVITGVESLRKKRSEREDLYRLTKRALETSADIAVYAMSHQNAEIRNRTIELYSMLKQIEDWAYVRR